MNHASTTYFNINGRHKKGITSDLIKPIYVHLTIDKKNVGLKVHTISLHE